MVESTSTPCTSCVIVQVPKASPELNWVEKVHGVESIVTIIALGIGALWALRSDLIKTKTDARAERVLRERERQQRDDQLNEQKQNREWEQTKIAREINEQFMDDPQAQVATALVDWDGDTFTTREKDQSGAPYSYDFTKKEDVQALRIIGVDEIPEKKDAFLRTCFDSWFYWMAAMEQYLQNGLIRQKDIAFPSDYYLRYLRKDEALYAACIKYVTEYQLSRNVLAFMKRFEDADAAATAVA
jgi:hypothetical protein